MSKSFAETAMELSGKDAAESTSIGKLDTADDQVEELFDDKHQTKNSPAFKAVWDQEFPTREFFEFDFYRPNSVMLNNCIDIVKKYQSDNMIYTDEGKLSKGVIQELANSGYYGVLVPLPDKPALSFSEFSSFLTKMASVEPSIAGMCSIHGCIGSVDPVRTFGNDYQKEKYLPGLADGTFLSAFALTEPCAGSDLTALKTYAIMDGNDYVLNGTKLFITNVHYGGLVSVVCRIDNKPQVLLVEIPDSDTETFKIGHYKIHALAKLNNNSLTFTNHRVPKENLISLDKGDGLTVAYHGLNLGRISLCANASGCMKTMLDSMLPWASYRSTYGQSIKIGSWFRRE